MHIRMTEYQELLRSACADAYHTAVACKFLSQSGEMTLDNLRELQGELESLSKSVDEAKAKARIEIKKRELGG